MTSRRIVNYGCVMTTFTECDLDLILDALLLLERATDEEGRAVAYDEDHVDHGDPVVLDRLAARASHATDLAHRVSDVLDVIRARAVEVTA